MGLFYCLPKGRLSEAAHGKRLLCAQKCTRGGVGWVCHGGVGWGWGGCVGGVGSVMEGWGGVCYGGGLSWRGGVYHGGVG